ncbi:hypothetical protein Aduo_008656 [Ancylostoma duodenale]
MITGVASAQPPSCYFCDRQHHRSLCMWRSSTSRNRDSSNTSHQTRSPLKGHDSESRARAIPSRESSPDSCASYTSGASPSRSPTQPSRPRQGSPHPRKVGFLDHPSGPSCPIQASTCVATPHEPTASDEECDDSLDELLRFHHTPYTGSFYYGLCTTVRQSSSSNPAPHLMVVHASTYNYKTCTEQQLTILLDSGSQYSFIRKSLATSLGLPLRCPQNITTLIFGGQKCTEESAQVALTLWEQSNQPVQLHLWTRQTIIAVPPMKNLEDPDSSPADKEDQVDVLIGIDYYWKILGLHGNKQLPSGLVLSHTRFGPVLSRLTDLAPPKVTSLVAYSSSNIKDSGNSGSDQFSRSLLGPGTVGLQHPASALVDAQVIEQVYPAFRVISGFICVTSPSSDHLPLTDDKVLTFWTFDQQLRPAFAKDVTVQHAISPNACKEVAWPHSTANIPSLDFQFCLGLFSNIYPEQNGSLMSTCYEDLLELFHHFWDLWLENQPTAFAEMNASSSRRQAARTQPRFGEVALLRPRNVLRSLWPDLIFLLFSKDGFLLLVSLRSRKKNRSINQLNPLAVIIVGVNACASIRQGFLSVNLCAADLSEPLLLPRCQTDVAVRPRETPQKKHSCTCKFRQVGKQFVPIPQVRFMGC